MPRSEKDPQTKKPIPHDPALRIVLAEMEVISRLLPVRGRPANRPGDESASEDDEDLFDNMPV
jgi:hypothetical protein